MFGCVSGGRHENRGKEREKEAWNIYEDAGEKLADSAKGMDTFAGFPDQKETSRNAGRQKE